MEFIHRHFQEDTIAAIATPPGDGGIAIIRISGPKAIEIASKIFSGKVESYPTHTAHMGTIKDIDQVLLLVMLGKRSYTGEDTVEIHCHGGSFVSKRVLEAVLEAGARAAMPGEFTKRAFLNGKLDLAQAEAVQILIGSRNEKALQQAKEQLEGALSEKVAAFQKELTDLAAILEAWVDFPEEGLEFASMEEICSQLEALIQRMQRLVDTFHHGKILHEGITLCLVGRPNVGKSSLMNLLLGKDRAIVTPIPGTTRDVLEDHLRLFDLHIRLLDTAGMRDTEEVIEQEGIRRSKKAMQAADVVLCILDVTQQELPCDLPKGKTVVIWNKIDLPHDGLPALAYPTVCMSAKEKRGIEDLYSALRALIGKQDLSAQEEIVLTSQRHKEALQDAIGSASQVLLGLRLGASPEFLTLDMRSALMALGSILGTHITEDILTSIFSKFCIGK